MIIDLLLVLAGFILLMKGGDYLVEGAVSVARIARLSPMVIGITVVGFGTSSPELLVSIEAALQHNSGIALGNVVGSNIANIGMILGLVCRIWRLPVKRSSRFRDLPFMMFAVVLMSAAGLSGQIDRWMGIAGLTLLILFCLWQVRHSRRHPEASDAEALSEFRPHKLSIALLIIVGSCLALFYGADILIEGASGLALNLGEHFGCARAPMERIVSLRLVADGTSLPELFASDMAARKGQTDMALGNIIGSVTFNILCVTATASAICPIGEANVGFVPHYIAMIGISLVLWLFSRSHHALVRWEGAVLLASYVAYLAYTFSF